MKTVDDNISVNTSSTMVLPPRASRRYAVIVNDSDETIYLTRGVNAVLRKGIRLNAGGGSYEIKPENLFLGQVNAICASGGKILTISEDF